MTSPENTPKLSAPIIAAAKPRPERYELRDNVEPGLRVRVAPTGVKSFRWSVLDKATGKQRVIVLGRFAPHLTPGFVTLTQAREWVDKLKVAHRAGRLADEEAALRAALAPPAPTASAGPTVNDVSADFYKRRIQPHRKRPEKAQDILDRDILPVIGRRPIAEVTTPECAQLVERVVDRKAPVHAGKVLAVLKQLFRFAQARGIVAVNPAQPLDPKDLGVQTNVSQRSLSAEEIPLFLKALEETRKAEITRTDYRTGKPRTFMQETHPLTVTTREGLRVLLYTGARSGELILARWEHVAFDETLPNGAEKPEAARRPTWTIPVENQKLTPAQAQRARPFVIPLTPGAVSALKKLQKAAGKSPWVLATDSEEGHLTDKVLGRAMRRLFAGKNPPVKLPGGPASPHDLRRTMRTHLGRLRVPLHIVERCLNHSLGRLVQIYDVGDYLDERREALERWDAQLHHLVTGKGAEVVPLNVQAVQS